MRKRMERRWSVLTKQEVQNLADMSTPERYTNMMGWLKGEYAPENTGDLAGKHIKLFCLDGLHIAAQPPAQQKCAAQQRRRKKQNEQNDTEIRCRGRLFFVAHVIPSVCCLAILCAAARPDIHTGAFVLDKAFAAVAI